MEVVFLNSSVLDWLETTADKFPTKSAFCDAQTSITFSELILTARAIGSALCAVTPARRPVAVISSRCAMTPAIFLGVVYSGCFYAPMDGSMPSARLQKMLSLLEPAVILADSEHIDAVRALGFNAAILCTQDCALTTVDDNALGIRRNAASIEDALYIIFTSGSTGTPKGVITSHQSLMCYIEAYTGVMGIDDSDILGNQSPLDYIAAVRDIYIPLLCGATTEIIPKEFFMSPVKLFDFMNERRITSVGWSVSAFTVPTSLGAFEHTSPEYLKKVCFSGSVMPCGCLRVWQEHLPEASFVNQYGPTEATASCTYYEVKDKVNDGDVLPIGRPYKNYRVFLLSEQNEAVADGEQGEICVSGPILALGYYNAPELTEKTFVQNPLNKGYRELIYKTGDLGVMRADGLLEFHGRKDRQIKHLGHRVELGEIELAAAGVAGLSQCCALYQKERELIYLFYTGSCEMKDIAVSLRHTLPGFMVPRRIVKLDELPRLANGKTDMQALTKLFS